MQTDLGHYHVCTCSPLIGLCSGIGSLVLCIDTAYAFRMSSAIVLLTL